MGESVSSQKGGFFRGALAGLILVVLIFCGLAAGFPLSARFDPSVAPNVEITTTNPQPGNVEQDSYGAISLPSESPAPTVFGANPVPFQATTEEVAIEPVSSAPVNAVSTLDSMPTSSGIEIGAAEDKAPVVELPVVPVLEAQAAIEAPVVEEESQAPVVVQSSTPSVTIQPTLTDAEDASDEEAVTAGESLEKPAGGFALSGQTIIPPAAVDETSRVENTSSTASFLSFRQPFENTGDLPLLSFVLLADDIATVDSILALPVPITLAVNVENPNAEGLISHYRDNGGEVVALLSTSKPDELQNGGSPELVAPFVSAALAATAGTIGVMDGPDGDVNQDTKMLTALFAELSKTGHAVLTVNGVGLNRAEILAKEAGVPAASISKVFGPEDGKVTVIRGMDKVILQMGDLKSVTVYASATSDLISALKFWLKSQKAKLVTIAPVSAVVVSD